MRKAALGNALQTGGKVELLYIMAAGKSPVIQIPEGARQDDRLHQPSIKRTLRIVKRIFANAHHGLPAQGVGHGDHCGRLRRVLHIVHRHHRALRGARIGKIALRVPQRDHARQAQQRQ